MSYISLQHTQFPVGPIDVNEAISFEQGCKSGDIEFDGKNVKINEPWVYVAHWHIPSRFVEDKYGDAPGYGRIRNILISLTKNGKIIGRSVTNVDERRNLDYDEKQEYSEIVSCVTIFRVDSSGANIALKNHSSWAIEVPTQANAERCPVCAGGSFAVYRIDDYDPCDDDCDDDDYSNC